MVNGVTYSKSDCSFDLSKEGLSLAKAWCDYLANSKTAYANFRGARYTKGLDMKRTYLEAVKAYEKGTPIMSDAQFDKLEAKVRAKYPNWGKLSATGTKLKKYKEVLDEFMPSLGKVYPEDFARWSKKYTPKSTFVTTYKLDGSSVQVVYDKGRPVKLVTRGNGAVGGGISYLLGYTTLPKKIKNKERLVLRLEAVMKKEVFAKYSKDFDTARNLVAGVLNRKLSKESKAILKDIDFVVLGVYGKKPLEGLLLAKQLGFTTTAYCAVVKLKNLNSVLTKELLNKDSYCYEMDGLVIAEANTPLHYDENERPKYMVAFKDNNEEDNAQLTTVRQVIWQPSHSGRLTPKVEIEPIDVDGVVITYATAHNAKWLKDRKIGKGAKIKVVRSGDVIPKIVEVVKGKLCKDDFPKEYVWRGVHVHEVKESKESQIQLVNRFLVVNGVKNISTGLIKMIPVKPTVLNYVKLAAISENRALGLLKDLGKKRSKQTLLELKHLKELDLIHFLVGTGAFASGVAVKRLQSIQEHVSIEMLAELSASGIHVKLQGIKGIGPALVKEIVEGMERAKPLLKEARKYVSIKETKVEKQQGRFSNMTACWTGYRSKEEEAKWLMEGGTVTSFSGKTTYLFYNPSKPSSKVAKAGDRAKLFSDIFHN